MTTLLCEACGREPRVGRIDVPEIGSFGIGPACHALHRKVLNSYPITLHECAIVRKFRTDDPAVSVWADELKHKMAEIVRCGLCKDAAQDHSAVLGCTKCICAETNALLDDEQPEVA